MRIAKMKMVLLCLSAAGFLFITACEEEHEPDKAYSVCDFTFKGKSYHFEYNSTWDDPVRWLDSESIECYSFDFRDLESTSDYNSVWITYEPGSGNNRDIPRIGTHPIDFMCLSIDGVEYGTSKNKGTITITRWYSHQGESDAEYSQSICEGSFSGTIVESDGSEYPIEGTFEGTIDDAD
jgi:hypothetical protein